jgi:hypothetical protein
MGETNETGGDVPRIDEPPHRIDPPDESSEREYDEQYLCEGMPAEPSLPFEQVSGVQVAGDPLDYAEADPAYRVRSIANRSALEMAVDIERSSDCDRLDAVDFDSERVVLIESGFGSSSVSQRFKRVELDGRTLHLHGCYTQPFVRTSDYTQWTTAVVVEHDQRIQHVRVSLTVAADRRATFDSTEGVVTAEQ